MERPKISEWQSHLEETRRIHEAAGLKYPRPKILCPECNTEGVIKWGSKMSTHFAHDSDTKRECKNQEESYIHKESKRRLCEFLNGGGVCKFSHSCFDKLLELPVGLTYRCEFRVNEGNSIFDIAGLNKQDCATVCIEIKNTHKTNNVEDRNKITWFEVEALQVLGELRESVDVKEITLRDIKTGSCCENKSKQMLNAEPTRLVDRMKARRDSMQDSSKSQVETSKVVKLSRAELHQMGTRLGYTFIMRLEKCEIVRKIATNQSFNYFEMGWYLTTELEGNKFGIMKDFVAHQQCLLCAKKWETSTGKPYCMTCWKTIKVCNDRDQPFVYASKHLDKEQSIRQEIRGKLRWLDDIHEESYIGCPCYFCKKTDRTSDMDPYVWWFGSKKPVCWECFDLRCEQDGLYDLEIGARSIRNWSKKH